jgi:hypothetical protein
MPIYSGPGDDLFGTGADALLTVSQWITCLLQGHFPWVEMDNRTIVCSMCHRQLARADSQAEAIRLEKAITAREARKTIKA